jgi:hypothetical protein
MTQFSVIFGQRSGVSPTIMGYNASAVENYSAISSIHSAFKKQKYFHLVFKKNSLDYYSAAIVVVSRRIGSRLQEFFNIGKCGRIQY